MGVISSVAAEAKALTSTRDATALWMLMEEGGSSARDRMSSIEDPILTFMILVRSARSERLRRIISGRGWSAILSWRNLVKRWKQRPRWTRPARPRRCAALLLAMKVSMRRLIWRFSSNLGEGSVQEEGCCEVTYLISRCLPVSITQVISGMVIPVSAMLVAEGMLSDNGQPQDEPSYR